MIIEQIGDDFGVAVRYDVQSARVEFVAYEVVCVTENGTKLYEHKGSSPHIVETESTDDAEPYIKGTVKWDGCSHYYFGEGGYLHLCGQSEIGKLTAAVAAIYQRCGVLLKEDGQNIDERVFDA